ncbi:MAG: CDP-alcohol phosphatidyltransferase family protein [Candidatus Omnitrophota bacterium]|nr:CDP-alcohol phosphatidyltransferase family protein [Candidatus Omnitrophota bacterium]
MLRKAIYPKFESLINRVAKALSNKGFTANQITLLGLAINFVAGWLFATGHLFTGTIIAIVAGISDVLDGAVARVTKKQTKFGAFLDSCVDRYSDLFLFGGIAVYFARNYRGDLLILTLGVIAGAFVTSYAKARAENFIPHCGVGVVDRFVRTVVLLLGTLIPAFLPIAIWLLFAGTNATAIHRILYTRKKLSEPVE